MEEVLDMLDEQIRTKVFKTPLCYYCKEKIPSGTRHYKYIGGQYKKFCSRGCMKLLKASYFQ